MFDDSPVALECSSSSMYSTPGSKPSVKGVPTGRCRRLKGLRIIVSLDLLGANRRLQFENSLGRIGIHPQRMPRVISA